ncbi:putative ATPase [Arthrobacter sp. CAN_A212]|uniref:AAA family ATPase n=1 Tax=Arthrobacter sp. CAN_A212 TaxID=2787719 RepID=UPI0018CA1C5C
MISSIRIKDFKRFRNLTLEFGQITVLTGMNGSGKSSVIQAILLADEIAGSPNEWVGLNNEFGIELGEAQDVLHQDSTDGLIEIEIDGATYILDAGNLAGDYTPYLTITSKPSAVAYTANRDNTRPIYLSAERLGPRRTSPTSSSLPKEVALGADGRFTAHTFAANTQREVHEGRRNASAGSVKTLRVQAEAWLSAIVGPIDVEPRLISGTNLAAIRMRKGGENSEWRLPSNMGFGVSYVLPIIIAGLLAPQGGLLIVDSPEAHLHPAGQSAIGEFLATVAGSGVQVIMETHSDHVLNGVRKAVSITKSIPSEQVSIHYFSDNIPPKKLKISPRGKLSEWPKGFFDQISIDLAALTKRRA